MNDSDCLAGEGEVTGGNGGWKSRRISYRTHFENPKTPNRNHLKSSNVMAHLELVVDSDFEPVKAPSRLVPDLAVEVRNLDVQHPE